MWRLGGALGKATLSGSCGAVGALSRGISNSAAFFSLGPAEVPLPLAR